MQYTHKHTHTCRCFIIDFHMFNNTVWHTFASVSQECRKREIIGLSRVHPGVCSLPNHSNISGNSPDHHCPVVMYPLGEENVLNCRSEVAMVFVCVCLRLSFPALPRVTRVICFPFSPAVLIDDHSLFHANTLLLSRVHYSRRVTLGKRGSLVGKDHSLCALHKVTVGKKGP